MSPRSFEIWRRRPDGRAGAMRSAGLAALLAFAPWPASAVVGGAESSGPLSRSAVMVLNSRGGVCSGVVLAPEVVLTAAHCVAGSGEFRVHYRGPDGAPVLIVPSGRTLHPGFAADAVAARRRSIDLALLRVPEPLPSRFAPATLSARTVPKGSALVLGGYGVAREGDARSTGTFRIADLLSVEPYGPSTILLWASGQKGVGACEGDSGGPMTVADGSVAALASWASGQGGRGCGGMSQGVLVGPQRAWIDRTLAGWGRTAEWR